MIVMILMYLGLGIGALIAAYVTYMLILAVVPGFCVPKQPLDRSRRPSSEKGIPRSRPRKDVQFEVNGTPLSAWLYLPKDLPAPVPCIIMGHGLGGTKAAGLDTYAVRFQDAGFAVLALDFRHLGDSGGEPRQLVWIPYQLEDFAAAIDFARGLGEIDPSRIALWGTSLSGGHVIVAAARDHGIACICSQVPLLAGSAGGMAVVKTLGLRHLLWMSFGHGLRDMVRSWFGLSPHKLPIFGKPGTVAMLADEDAWNTLSELAPDDFVNEICARIIIRIDKYRPIRYAAKVRCPVLLQVCDQDIGLPARVVEEAEKRLGSLAEVIHYPADHFDIYLGSVFEKAVSDQVAFFGEHLRGGRES